ncbi:LexA family protein [Rhodanobacter sp. FW106-PBR-LB-2-11]|uniref:LexA family protein n=1 Tax=Rhodanobacter sp. FW106-PBR-LB-2-11 TaxID=1524463 RepID=UPI0034E4F552
MCAAAYRRPVPFKESAPAVEATLREHYVKHGVMPSLSELQAELKSNKITTSKSSLACVIDLLVDAGLVLRGHAGRLMPGENFAGFPIGRPVPAGSPDTGDLPVERRSIDRWLAPHPAVTGLVPIRGESMIDAGLLNGDTAVFEDRRDAKPGDIVYALIDEEETIKFLASDANGLYLEPGNSDPQYQPMRPERSLEILGVVIGSFGRRGRAATGR